MPPVSKELLEWGEKQKVKETLYQTKTFRFFGQSTPIVLQNENGPCPLIAVCNILSLRNKLGLSPYTTCVSERKLLTLVAESLFTSHSKAKDQKTISDVIDVLPLLAKGLDVNVRFTSINDIEFTRECKVFGLLDIPVYHGWLMDPQDSETSNAIGSKSYNTLMSDLVDLANRNMEDVSMKNSEEDGVEHVEKEHIREEHEENRNTKAVSMSSSEESRVEHVEKEYIAEELTKIVDPSSANLDGDRVTFETNPKKASHDRQVNTSEPERHESKDVIEEASTEVVENKVKSDGDSLAFGKTTSNEASSSAPNAVLELSVEMTDTESRPLTARQGELVKEFLDNNKTQLTVYGLICLHEGLEDRELCVFFRNNHLSTMLKYQGELYTLVTDLGYQHHPRVIWEKLSEVNGDTVYVCKNFRIYKPGLERGAWDLESTTKNEPYLYSAEATTSTSTNLSSDQQQESEEKQLQPQHDKVIQQQVLKGKQSQQVLEEKQSQPQHDKVFQQQFLEGKQSQQESEEKQSQQEIEEEQSEPQHAEVSKQLVLEAKERKQESEGKQPQQVSPAPLPTGSNAGPEHEHSIRPRNPTRTPPGSPTRTQPRSPTRNPPSTPTRDPPRNPTRKPSKKESKRSKKKCSLM